MNGDHILYLTSTGCLDTYPNNNSDKFINRLTTPIVLENNVEYEVGLISILYPDQYYGLLANDDRYAIVVHTGQDKLKIKNFTTTVKLHQNILAGDLEKMVNIVNRKLMNYLKSYYSAIVYKRIFNQSNILKWNNEENRVEIHSVEGKNYSGDISSIDIKLNSGLARVFGFNSNSLYNVFNSKKRGTLLIHKSPITPSARCNVDYIYMYTDIIQPSNFGGQLVNVLDCFSLQNGGNKGIHNSIYKPLNTHFIDQISVMIRDQHARPIHFTEESTVTCVIHIRPR